MDKSIIVLKPTSIRLSPNNLKELSLIKIHNDCKTLDEVITTLIKEHKGK